MQFSAQVLLHNCGRPRNAGKIKAESLEQAERIVRAISDARDPNMIVDVVVTVPAGDRSVTLPVDFLLHLADDVRRA